MKGHQMLAKLRKDRENEEGFTLIELLVVVIIIGILAAIAIPAFLNQRERAWQSELTSTVRNVALEVESAATQANGNYATALGTDPLATVRTFAADLQGAPGTPVNFVTATATSTGFTMCAEHVSINDRGTDHNVRYDSANGGLQDYVTTARCTTTTTTQ